MALVAVVVTAAGAYFGYRHGGPLSGFDHAGVSCMSIEDTSLPTPFGQAEGTDTLISTAEMVGKLRAAVEARGASDVMIAGRTADAGHARSGAPGARERRAAER